MSTTHMPSQVEELSLSYLHDVVLVLFGVIFYHARICFGIVLLSFSCCVTCFGYNYYNEISLSSDHFHSSQTLKNSY